MAKAFDTAPGEKCVNLNLSVSHELRDLIENDAKNNCNGLLSVWARHIFRKHYGLKTYLKDTNND